LVSEASLFPSISPFREGVLALGHGHQMHWQLSGNPQGQPVLWIHGGPGSSASPMHRRLFDPQKYLIIQYDQRGCGRSQPKGEVQHNTTQDLLADIERLRQMLGLPVWHVAGGSWGGSLALLYAQAHPEVVSRLLLRSPFLCTDREIDAYLLTPPAACQAQWQQLVDLCHQAGPTTILRYSQAVFLGNAGAADTAVNRSRQIELARAWAVYEAAMDAFPVDTRPPTRFDDEALIARYRVHLHYLWFRCFIERPILSHPERLKHLDLTMVHGDHDALCPFENSLDIQRQVPNARLVRVAGAGHNAFDARMVKALMHEISAWTFE